MVYRATMQKVINKSRYKYVSRAQSPDWSKKCLKFFFQKKFEKFFLQNLTLEPDLIIFSHCPSIFHPVLTV